MKGGNFQSESKRQGEMFEAQAAIFLKSLGFQLSGKRTLDKIGCEVDELAFAPNGSPAPAHEPHRQDWGRDREGCPPTGPSEVPPDRWRQDQAADARRRRGNSPAPR
jgi:hypothetical protein